MSNFLWIIFAIRPIIDLFWESDILFGMNLAGATAILVIALGCLWLVEKNHLYLDMVSISGMIFVVFTFAVTILFHNAVSDFAYPLRFFSGFLFYMPAMFLKKEKFERILQIYIIITLVPIILTYLQVAGLVEYTYFDHVAGMSYPRGSGGYRQPSVLTRNCIFGLIYTLYFLEEKWKTVWQKYFACLYMGLNLVAVFLSYHRTGYFMTIIVLLLWFYMQNRGHIGKYLGKILSLGIGGVLLFAILYACGVFSIDLSMFKHLISFENFFRMENGKWVFHLRGRRVFIEKLFQSFSEHPWYNVMFGNGSDLNKSSGMIMNIADMNIVRVLWNIGIIGGIIWIIHLIAFWLKLYNLKQCKKSNNLERMEICILITFLLWGLILETTMSPNILIHLYLVSGYALKQNRKDTTVVLQEKECVSC